MARESTYTEDTARRVCEALAEKGSLRRVCADDASLPSDKTVRRWLAAGGHVLDGEAFETAYARAKEAGIDALVDETLDIADDGTNDYTQTEAGPKLDSEHVQRSKIRIETRRWLAERMLPKKYGARTGVDVTNSDGTLAADESARAARMKALLALAEQRKSIDDLV